MRALLVMLIFTGAWAGCALPPSHFSTRSAASIDADPARATGVGIALREDPPLPGRDATGWSGLTPAAPGMGMAGMDHSHMHHAGGAAAAPAAGEHADHAHMHHGAEVPPEPSAPPPEAIPETPEPESTTPGAPTLSGPAPAGGHVGGHDGH